MPSACKETQTQVCKAAANLGEARGPVRLSCRLSIPGVLRLWKLLIIIIFGCGCSSLSHGVLVFCGCCCSCGPSWSCPGPLGAPLPSTAYYAGCSVVRSAFISSPNCSQHCPASLSSFQLLSKQTREKAAAMENKSCCPFNIARNQMPWRLLLLPGKFFNKDIAVSMLISIATHVIGHEL